MLSETLIFIRGAGDLATGVAARLWRSGFSVVMTELAAPLLVRRAVSLGEAVRLGQMRVETLVGVRARVDEVPRLLAQGVIPVCVDPDGAFIPQLTPAVIIDARMAKRNIDTHRTQAPLVIGLGPGFVAGNDVHAVVETKRGHALGRVVWQGGAAPNTGIPDPVAGHGSERVLRAPVAGRVLSLREIGDSLTVGEAIANLLPLSEQGAPTDLPPIPVLAPFAGTLRGLIADGTAVSQGLKIGDLDPRGVRAHCFTISDKALAIGGGALEAVLSWFAGRGALQVPAPFPFSLDQ